MEHNRINYVFKVHGFTLIELLVVIAIIGILATVILVSLNTARQRARDARRASDINQISLAAEMYYDQSAGVTPSYPSAANWASAWSLLQNYIPSTNDPSGQTSYYKWLPNGSDPSNYCIISKSEAAPIKYVYASKYGVFTSTSEPGTIASCK